MIALMFALVLTPVAQAAPAPIDVSKITVGPAVVITELDLGKLKGEIRQIGWSANALEIYVQTVEGNPSTGRLHHYVASVLAGTLQPVDAQPSWAQDYWAFKSDRVAPGLPSIEIDVKQEHTTEKIGTGSGRPGTAALEGPAGGAAATENASMAGEGQKLPVVKFLLFGETVSEFKNERPIPGMMFGWGPAGTGSIVYTDRDGRMMLLDREKHKQHVPGVKDASFPAWSADGAHIAWIQKAGRKKFTLMAAPVGQ